ncbi:uncharacterized protein LOC126376287 [Pectinophora gossypiella]|uniref:uncharacterized protein LOC126376287 n=1 Tax=Pectinophora gossypiella TaxID=13191 RepID=UPI00214E1E8E|nr:uncharacterized protein LOC126376287 [Pectinophora gossypiella]
MEYLPKNEILEFNPDTFEFVRKTFGLDKPGAMSEAVDILEEWIKKQQHFTTKKISREFLERVIIANKGSIERSKERLDRLLTLRTLSPKFFKNYDARYDFQGIQNIITYVLLPKLNKDHERIFLCRVVGKKFSPQMYLDGYRFSILFAQYIKAHDYASAYHVVIDYRAVDVANMLANANISDLREGVATHMEGYGLRLKGVHILTDSHLVDAIISIAKQVVSAKIGQRIHTHKKLDTLYDYIPKELLPVEYGGKERPIMQLHADWMKIFSSEEFRQYWKDMIAIKTDESLRQTDKFNEQYMGMPGTFRTLSVD